MMHREGCVGSGIEHNGRPLGGRYAWIISNRVSEHLITLGMVMFAQLQIPPEITVLVKINRRPTTE